MVIALLLPTLQILDMGRISSTHLVITQMGIIRGYERFQAPFIFFFVCAAAVCNMFQFLLLDQDGYQQNYKRGTGQGPRGVSRGSSQVIRS